MSGTAGPPPAAYLPAKNPPCIPGSAIGLPNGKILTWDGCWTVFDPATGTFTPTGKTTLTFQDGYEPRYPAVLLASGQVYFPNGEIYDPAAGRFYPTPDHLATPNRLFSNTATLLADGRVFVLAYDTADPNEQVAGHVAPQVYDPRTGRATPTAAMPVQLDGLVATLANGRVLVVGGANPLETKQALLYDPATDTYTETGPTVTQWNGQSCIATLGDGRVLLAGGGRIAEVYSPAAGRFAIVATMPKDIALAECVTLADGRVLVLGVAPGEPDTPLGPFTYSAQIYDPQANRWQNLGHLASPRLYGPAIVPLADGRAVVLGGETDTAQFFDPKTNKFVANG